MTITQQNTSLTIQQIYQNLPNTSWSLIESLRNNNTRYLENNFRYKIGKKNLRNCLYFFKNLPLINEASDEAVEDYEFLIDLATLKALDIVTDI